MSSFLWPHQICIFAHKIGSHSHFKDLSWEVCIVRILLHNSEDYSWFRVTSAKLHFVDKDLTKLLGVHARVKLPIVIVWLETLDGSILILFDSNGQEETTALLFDILRLASSKDNQGIIMNRSTLDVKIVNRWLILIINELPLIVAKAFICSGHDLEAVVVKINLDVEGNCLSVVNKSNCFCDKMELWKTSSFRPLILLNIEVVAL